MPSQHEAQRETIMTDLDIDELLEVAGAATKIAPGDWERDYIDSEDGHGKCHAYAVFIDRPYYGVGRTSLVDTINSENALMSQDDGVPWDENGRLVCDHIATFDPPTVTAILLRLKASEAENERLRLAILGGEDAPGLAASLTLEEVIECHLINVAGQRNRAELAEYESEKSNVTIERLTRELGEAKEDLEAETAYSAVVNDWAVDACELHPDLSRSIMNLRKRSKRSKRAAEARVEALETRIINAVGHYEDWLKDDDYNANETLRNVIALLTPNPKADSHE